MPTTPHRPFRPANPAQLHVDPDLDGLLDRTVAQVAEPRPTEPKWITG